MQVKEKLRYQTQAVDFVDLPKIDALKELLPIVQPTTTVVCVDELNQAMVSSVAILVEAVEQMVKPAYYNVNGKTDIRGKE